MANDLRDELKLGVDGTMTFPNGEIQLSKKSEGLQISS